ncbi:MAG: B12-binding domain-containing radical SAM protein [Candidatus Omnitrophica bacterium]|nr:B12-binding domain-containing radical SAM protein [Candidatus Omnitrophota bacterium]
MKNNVLLIYPPMGFSGTFVCHPPLSLIYAAAELVKKKIPVTIFDARTMGGDWKKKLSEVLRDTHAGLSAVGISVMSGRPIAAAIEISRRVKKIAPHLPVIWGGPHATFYPETCFQCADCDYVIRGYGSRPLEQLVSHLQRSGRQTSSGIAGVSERNPAAPGNILHHPATSDYEIISYPDIPYHLINDYSPYRQLDGPRRIFSLYSSFGCPHQCAFCSSPAYYKNFFPKYLCLPPQDVAAHAEHLVRAYAAGYLYFIDDDSFVHLAHIDRLLDELLRRNLRIGLGFRGAHVNEINRMSDAFLEKLTLAGTDILHIGAESGSDRMLALMRKNCTRANIIAANRKLARYPRIKAAYNFVFGIPTETYDDMRATKELIEQLVAENPAAVIFPPNRYRPLPGTALFNQLGEHGQAAAVPRTLEQWCAVEVEGQFPTPWIRPPQQRYFKLIFLGSYFIDRKIERLTSGSRSRYRLLRILARLYLPLLRLRWRFNLSGCLIEWTIFRIFKRRRSR